MVAQFSTLLNPGRPIPFFIQVMTGITNDMVRDAPPFQAVIPSLLDFLGDSTLVAHNAPFDMRAGVGTGVTPIGVTWGFFGRPALEASGARTVVSTPAELEAVLLGR